MWAYDWVMGEHRYFVSYLQTTNGQGGFGNVVIATSAPIKSVENVDTIALQVTRDKGFTTVVILNYILMDGPSEDMVSQLFGLHVLIDEAIDPEDEVDRVYLLEAVQEDIIAIADGKPTKAVQALIDNPIS